MSKAMEQVRQDLPHLSGPVPGPRAQAIIERDAAVVSPSYTRVAIRWWPDAVKAASSKTSTAIVFSISTPASPWSPPAIAIRASSRRSASRPARLIHMSGTDFYYEGLVASGGETRANRAGRCGAPRFVRQLRRGSDRGRHETGALRPPAAIRSSPSSALSRPHHGRAFVDRRARRCSARLRAAGARRRARAVSQLLPMPVRTDAGSMRGGVRPASSKTRCSRPSRRREETAAIVIEPVQGEGGYIVPPQKFFDELRAHHRQARHPAGLR